MDTRRFGRKIKLPSTAAIKHQILKLMLEDYRRAQALGGTPTEDIDAEASRLQKPSLRAAQSV